MSETPYTNRLIKEKSPHLLQHAHNPIDWYPWGEEAFLAAQKQDKPIFLSVGYSTSHWCHMMERECFSNEEIGETMNKIFINVKVDKEELPEVDALYMEFAQTMMVTGVNWPLNIVLTPNLRPFFAMTYLPLGSESSISGLNQMIFRISEIWNSRERASVLEQADKIVETFALTVHTQGEEEDFPDASHLEGVAQVLFKLADPLFGGMKGDPKYLVPCHIFFLLRYVYSSSDARSLFYVERTLDRIARGGIHDHLGGGFSSYSVDDQWVIPRFEKMIFDNALLGRAYFEAWTVTKNEEFRRLYQETLDYILRTFEHDKGGFFSSEDADLYEEEGLYYTWSYDEVQEIISPEISDLFCEFFDITSEGNFNGRNVLHTPFSLREFAEHKGLDELVLHELFESQLQFLRYAREHRLLPFKDDKIICAWNGLTINTLALVAQSTFNERYLLAAKNAARFIKANMWIDGNLMRHWRDGKASCPATLEDYAFLTQALLTLFEVDGDAGWLAWAMQLTALLEKHFKADKGAFFTTSDKDNILPIKRCEFVDGSLPSGNAVHCENLLRLYQMTYNVSYLTQAESILIAVKDLLDSLAPSFCYHLLSLHRYLDEKTADIVVALNNKEEHQKEIARILADKFVPFRVVIWRREDDEHLFELLPHVKRQPLVNEKTTVYICQNGRCMLPLTDLDAIATAIKGL